MKLSPLLVLLAVASAPAGAQVQASAPAKLTSAQQGFLRENGIDPRYISAQAFQRSEDPAAFVRQNQQLYDRFARWRENPELMLAAEQKKPGSAQAALSAMSAFISPQEVGNLQAQLKLASRGIKAEVPKRDAERASVDASPAAAGGAGDEASPAAPAPPSGLRTAPIPGPAPQPPAKDGGGWSFDDAMRWACSVLHCI